MVVSIQNSETGEVEVYHIDTTALKLQTFDEETGEPLNDKYKIRYLKLKSFQIPKKYLRGTICDELEKQMVGNDNQDNVYGPITVRTKPQPTKKPKEHHYEREDYMNMEGVETQIILGYKKASYRLFLIPSLFMFNVYFGLFMAVTESILHYWAHIKNGLNMNKKIYYQSPLHVLTSQFCAVCRSESEMELELFKMLNQKMRKARNSKPKKDVSKVIT